MNERSMNEQALEECLADLIDVAADAAVTFHVAAGEVRSEEARVLLLDRAQRYGRAAARLRAATAARGRVHRAAAAPVATRIGPADEAEVLAECEERESAVVVVFRDALEGRLPAALHGLIAAEFELLLGSLGSLAAVRERAVRQRRFFVGEPG